MSLLEMFSYPFMQRALAAGILVSLCAALLGVPLVLKRYSMIGDGLSHVSFGALAIAVALGVTPLYFSIPVVILAAFFLLRMASHPRWNSDAAIAVMSASALAIVRLLRKMSVGDTVLTSARASAPPMLPVPINPYVMVCTSFPFFPIIIHPPPERNRKKVARVREKPSRDQLRNGFCYVSMV